MVFSLGLPAGRGHDADIEKNHRKTPQQKREALAGLLFALPSLAGFALFFVIPFFMSLYYCFTEGIGGTRFAGFKNFESLLSSESFLLAAKNTLIFNGVAVPLIILVSLGFALLLNTGIKGLSFTGAAYPAPGGAGGLRNLVWQVIP